MVGTSDEKEPVLVSVEEGRSGPRKQELKGPHVSEELNWQPVGLAYRQPERVGLGEKELEGAGCSQGDLRSRRALSRQRTLSPQDIT